MNYESASAVIRRHFAEQWGNITPVAYDDVPFNIPNGQTWVRLSIQHALGYQATLGSPGSNQFRREGLVTVQIFQPEGQGSKDARKKADLAVAVFQRPRVAGIAFKDVRMNEVGNDGAGWYHVNVKAEFEYDTIA